MFSILPSSTGVTWGTPSHRHGDNKESKTGCGTKEKVIMRARLGVHIVAVMERRETKHMRCKRMEVKRLAYLGGPRSCFVYIDSLVCRIGC